MSEGLGRGGLIWLVVSLAACAPDAPPAPPAQPELAAAEAGMCQEHGVLEALCTQCNSALIPVFKKKGDWCAEHGLPESICPICHPERGGRPPESLDLALDASPPDGIRVRLASVEAGLVAGLRTAAIEAAHPEREVGAIATIQYDATRVARINPRASGVVTSLSVGVGSVVEAGAELAQIESAAVGEGEARLVTARAQLRLARRQLARSETLLADGATSIRAVDEARGVVREAQGDIAALAAQQAVVGQIDGPSYRITSPLAGIVMRRATSIGAFVDTEDLLFEVVDTAVMWAEVEVAEMDIAAVPDGLEVVVTVPTLGDRTFVGRVAYVAPEVDPHSRTVLVRAALDNTDGLLRANMFARAQLRAPTLVFDTGTEPERDAQERPKASKAAWLVPRDAIQAAKDVFMVFVQIAPDVYEGRRVVVGRAAADGRVAVTGRLAEGERIVDRGAFILKTETLKDSIGAGCCADEGGL